MTVKKLSDEENKFVDNSVEAAIRIGLIFVLVVWCFDILKPFIMFIMWGIIIAVASYPIFLVLKTRMGGKNGLTAVVLTLLALILLITPIISLSTSFIDSIQQLSADLQNGQLVIPPPSASVAEWPLIGESLYPAWVLVSEDIEQALVQFVPQLEGMGSALAERIKNTGLSILQFVGSIILAGVLHANARSSITLIEDIAARLGGQAGVTYSRLAGKLIGSVTLGILGVAIIQAVLAGIGFMIAGVPAAGLWAFIVLLMGVVQIGPMILILPIGIYMLGELATLSGIIFLIWCIAVGLVDNVLKPVLLARGLDAPMAVVFLGAIGGFITTGFIGLFVGAIVLVVGWALLMAWIHGDSEEIVEEALEQMEGDTSL